MTLNQQEEEMHKWNTPDQLYSPSTGAETKNYVQELRSLQVLADKLEYSVIQDLSGPV